MNEPDFFVVRIWRRLASGFHASVRRVDDEETHHFAQPDQVARFLSAAPQASAESDREQADPTAPRDESH